jgi:rhamnulokinase
MTEPLFIAVDLGAGSGRVFLTSVAPGELQLEEIRRFRYPAENADGHLRWPFEQIWEEIKRGLKSAAARAAELERPIQSLAVNSWGVDYGLIDTTGGLIADPICYRDGRTENVMEQVFARIPRAELFERTGIQFQRFNTLFQLFAEQKSRPIVPELRFLMIPDLINFRLTGQALTEYSNATTTQMVNVHTCDWDRELVQRLGLPDRILPAIVPAGTVLGPIDAELGAKSRLAGVTVIAPATHDTASAVAGTPLNEGWAYISSGTWSLVGIERDRPLINAETERFNLTNEGGAFGTVRLLKNVMGLWILEQCRNEWAARNQVYELEELLDGVSTDEGSGGLIFPDDLRFFSPPSMLDAVAAQLTETGQDVPGDPIRLSKIVLDSLAFRYASVLRRIETLAETKIRGVHIVGGGSQNEYLNQLTADATGLPVQAGPVEATVTGNVLVQAIAAGRFSSLAEARRHVAATSELRVYQPWDRAWLPAAAAKYAGIEARYLN